MIQKIENIYNKVKYQSILSSDLKVSDYVFFFKIEYNLSLIFEEEIKATISWVYNHMVLINS